MSWPYIAAAGLTLAVAVVALALALTVLDLSRRLARLRALEADRAAAIERAYQQGLSFGNPILAQALQDAARTGSAVAVPGVTVVDGGPRAAMPGGGPDAWVVPHR